MLTPLMATEVQKKKLKVGLSFAANFSELGLNNATKKAEFAYDFEISMAVNMGLNKNQINVESVWAGKDCVVKLSESQTGICLL
jgi:hypothetical protein